MSHTCDMKDAEFTIVWKIRHLTLWNELEQEDISSPVFYADSLHGTKWDLCLNRVREKESFDLLLQRLSQDAGPEELNIDVWIEILKDGKKLKSLHIPQDLKAKRNFTCGIPNVLKQDEIFSMSPESVLTIECHIKNSVCNMHQICRSTTELDVERVSFVWSSGLKISDFREVSVNAMHVVNRAPPLDIFLTNEIHDDDEALHFVFDAQDLLDEEKILSLVCRITLLNDERKPGPSAQSRHFFEFEDEPLWTFPFLFTINDLDEPFLEPFIFRFDLEFSYGKLTSEIEEIKHIPQNTEDLKCHHSEDLLAVFNEGLFHDVKLRLQDETFPAHKDILCIRSPVLKSKILEDPDANEITVTDMDHDTLHNFLKCLYSRVSVELLQSFFGTMEGDNWAKLKKLYAVADKYQVEDLKNTCSILLASSIQSENVFELMKLADLHTDESLKDAANKYFSTHTEEVIKCDAFKKLLKLK